MSIPRLFSFWSGTQFGYLERICIASMLAAGHSLDIYSYDADLAAPEGVTLRDARDIIPESRVIRHETGSLALFSDIFRYEALLQEAGIWIDLDMLLLKPIEAMGDHIFGWQDGYVINGAILRLPPDCQCLKAAVELCRSDVVVPPQWPRRKKVKQRIRAIFGRHVPVQNLEWGAIGPLALTRLIADFRLQHKSQPADVFYPVPWQEAHLTFAADASLVWSSFTSSTRSVHLWNDRVKDLKNSPPPRGSFIAEMSDRYGIECS